MTLITWNEQLSVNIAKIDTQHRILFNNMNALFDEMEAGREKDATAKVLSKLEAYTVYHFDTEEKMFQEYGYPGYEQHKKEHDVMRKQVDELKDNFNKGDIMITLKVLNFFKDWLKKHISISDKKYSPFLTDKGVE